MITIRPSAERGSANFGWLDTKHTFSFGSYYDPKYTGFGNLLVINEDIISPGQGFGTHGHQDMEIVTYVIAGELAHKDSIGNEETIPEGEVQRMTAGTGIRHSEYNHSNQDLVHLLQIWILPDTKNLTPSYEQKSFSRDEKQGKLCLLVSGDGRENSIKIHQNVDLFASILNVGESVTHSFDNDDYGWIQVIKGEISIVESTSTPDKKLLSAIENTSLSAGDGASIQQEKEIKIISSQPDTEFLWFHFKS
ncbi:pirin family protein [Geminocystis sp. NIES-3709]|uniref:pirin family protein n=1 Tax=Geminocystis sp. NIES-3709 TaxID=1617448 RepID=UPI0005FC840F|nr:pirin family protein [Geminocystis sp. NIES-3709]BAQ65240.1 pirin [Geminocystis sp. NIES-3709]